MKRKSIGFILLAIMMLLFTGCSYEEDSGVDMSTETKGVIGKSAPIEAEAPEMTTLETNHDVVFGNDIHIQFTPSYAIDTARAKNWMFTQSSSIDLQLAVGEVPEGLDVMVTQVYSDISLVAKKAKYNGIRQDSLNIEYHALPTGGISIRNGDSYSMPFMVEAVDKSETFFYMWNGYGTESTTRITETKLASVVHGAALNTVWTIFVKDTQTGNLYIKTITDRIGIPYERSTADE